MVPPQFTAKVRPLPVPTDRKRDIGRTRLRLLQISAEPLRKEFGAVLLLPCTKRQLSGKRMGALTGFRHCVCIFITLPLFPSKVNDFFKIKPRKMAKIRQKSYRAHRLVKKSVLSVTLQPSFRRIHFLFCACCFPGQEASVTVMSVLFLSPCPSGPDEHTEFSHKEVGNGIDRS